MGFGMGVSQGFVMFNCGRRGRQGVLSWLCMYVSGASSKRV